MSYPRAHCFSYFKTWVEETIEEFPDFKEGIEEVAKRVLESSDDEPAVENGMMEILGVVGLM